LSFSTLLKGVRFLDVAVVVALAAALSLGRLRGRRASPVMDLAFALFGYALAIAAARGLLNAAQRSQALIEIRRLAPLALYLPATVVMPARSSRRLIWWGFVVGCTAAGVWEVGSAITHNVRQLDLGLPIYAGDRKALFGSLLRPAGLTATNCVCFAPALVRGLWGGSGRKARLALLIVLAATVPAIIVDLNRSRWLAAALALVLCQGLLAIARRRDAEAEQPAASGFLGVTTFARLQPAALRVSAAFTRSAARIAAVAGFVGAAVFVTGARQGVSERLLQLAKPFAIRGVAYRFNESGAMLAAFRAAPLFGTGLGHAFLVQNPFAAGPFLVRATNWHDDFVFLLAKTGLFGLLAFVFLLVAALLLGVRTTMRAGPADRPEAAALTAILAAAIVPAFSQATFFGTDFVVVLAMLLAFVSCRAVAPAQGDSRER
jgi:hypothetical protein